MYKIGHRGAGVGSEGHTAMFLFFRKNLRIPGFCVVFMLFLCGFGISDKQFCVQVLVGPFLTNFGQAWPNVLAQQGFLGSRTDWIFCSVETCSVSNLKQTNTDPQTDFPSS